MKYMESSILKNMYLMSWTDALRVHDRLLKVAFHFSSKRLRDVTEGEQAIAVDACGPKDASPAVEDRLFRDLELNPKVFIFMFKLINDGLKPGKLVLVSGPRGTEKSV